MDLSYLDSTVRDNQKYTCWMHEFIDVDETRDPCSYCIGVVGTDPATTSTGYLQVTQGEDFECLNQTQPSTIVNTDLDNC